MAGLKKVLTGNKNLALTSEEELQNLSSKSGRILPPSSPVESSQLGANADQAKMTGSKANLQSTLKQAAQPAEAPTSAAAPAQSLQQALDYRKARTEKTSPEQMQADLAQRLSTSGDYLVKQAGQAALDQFTEAAATGVSDDLSLVLEGAKDLGLDAASTTALDNILGGRGTAEDYNIVSSSGKLNELTALVTFQAGGSAAATLWTNALGDFGGQVGGASAAAIADTVSVKELYGEDEWATVEAELMAEYNLTPEDMKKLTVQELQTKIDEKIQSDFQQTERMMDILNDPNATAATRAEAARQLRDLGALDIAALEMDDMMSLAMAVEDADQVEVNGQTYDIADLLDDKRISGVVSAFVNGKKGDPAYDAALSELDSLGMTAWVNANKEVLTTASAKLTTDVTAMSDVQHRQSEADKESSTAGWDVAHSGFVSDVTKNVVNEIYDASKNGADTAAVQAKSLLGTLAGSGLKDEVLTLSADNLKSIAADSEKMKDVSELIQATNDLSTVDHASSPNSIMDNFEAIIADAVKMSMVNSRTGRGGAPGELTALDKNHDGQLDADWKNILKDMMGKGSLKDILGGKQNYGTIDKLKNTLTGTITKSGLKAEDFDAQGLIKANLVNERDLGTLEALYKEAPGTFPSNVKYQMMDRYKREDPEIFNGKANYEDLLRDITGAGDLANQENSVMTHAQHIFDKLKETPDGSPKYIALKETFDKLNKTRESIQLKKSNENSLESRIQKALAENPGSVRSDTIGPGGGGNRGGITAGVSKAVDRVRKKTLGFG